MKAFEIFYRYPGEGTQAAIVWGNNAEDAIASFGLAAGEEITRVVQQ